MSAPSYSGTNTHLEIESLTMDTNVSDTRDIHLESYLLVFALVFLYYDHFITIDREIKVVWARPKNRSAHLFLANRYFLFSVNIVVVLFEFMPFKFLKRFGVFSTISRFLK
ncbi:hypothetical protein BD779DRAFT_250708 [Infundibulicybe gibba]|nr:hypothetical protein BD779DRAFT_250708 [Infundibulicybe gibba]